MNMKNMITNEDLTSAGYSEKEANYLVLETSANVVENNRPILNPITMQFNLESGIVTYEQLEAAKQQINDRLDQLRQIWASSPIELDQEQVARLNHGMETLGAKLNRRPAPITPKESSKLPPREWTALLYGESIPFEWATKPFARGNVKSGTLFGVKDEIELKSAISRVFPQCDARELLKTKTLTTQEAALLLIDGWRRNADMAGRTEIPCRIESPGKAVQQPEINDTLVLCYQQKIMDELDRHLRHAPSASQVFLGYCRDRLSQAEMHRQNSDWAKATIKLRIKSLRKFLKENGGLVLEHFFVDRSMFNAPERILKDYRAKKVSAYSLGELHNGESEDDD